MRKIVMITTSMLLMMRNTPYRCVLLFIELLDFKLILCGFIRIWWESHLCLIHLIEHHRGFYTTHLCHFKASLFDSFLVDPGAAGILHIGCLIELRGLLSSTRRHTKFLCTYSFTCSILCCLKLSDWTRFDRHLWLKFTSLWAYVLGRFLEDKLFRG